MTRARSSGTKAEEYAGIRAIKNADRIKNSAEDGTL
jgi:hypothetical protein